jgi:hypothetical protein
VNDKRLDKVFTLLSARERGLLTLRDYKEGKPQDRAILDAAPSQQTTELNGYIRMINAANGEISSILLVIRERVVQEELRWSYLVWAHMAALEAWCFRGYFDRHGREPITQSEYRERLEQARQALIPIEECANTYTEEHHVFDDADYAIDEDGDDRPTDDAWYRVRDAKLAELQRAVADRTLTATGKGKRAKIAAGAFYDWLGVAVPVVPEFGAGFDVRPDDRWREVAWARRDHAFIRERLDLSAHNIDLPLDMESPLVWDRREKGGFGIELARILAVQLRSAVLENWRELRACEHYIDEYTEAFDEDVLKPSVRQRLEETKEMLQSLHKRVQKFTGPFDFEDPDDDLKELIGRIAAHEIRRG